MRLRFGPRRSLGAWGEDRAARHLKKNGYRLLGRNVRCKAGEIDILATDAEGKTLVVVEVKTRAITGEEGPRSPRPEDALTRDKRARLLRLAEIEAKRRRWAGLVRIDVIAIERGPHETNLRHHRAAVTPG